MCWVKVLPLSCLHRASPSASDESPDAGLWLGSLADSPPAPTQAYKYMLCTQSRSNFPLLFNEGNVLYKAQKTASVCDIFLKCEG